MNTGSEGLDNGSWLELSFAGLLFQGQAMEEELGLL